MSLQLAAGGKLGLCGIRVVGNGLGIYELLVKDDLNVRSIGLGDGEGADYLESANIPKLDKFSHHQQEKLPTQPQQHRLEPAFRPLRQQPLSQPRLGSLYRPPPQQQSRWPSPTLPSLFPISITSSPSYAGPHTRLQNQRLGQDILLGQALHLCERRLPLGVVLDGGVGDGSHCRYSELMISLSVYVCGGEKGVQLREGRLLLVAIRCLCFVFAGCSLQEPSGVRFFAPPKEHQLNRGSKTAKGLRSRQLREGNVKARWRAENSVSK